MSEAFTVLSHVAQFIRDLKVNPWLVAVTLALGVAWLEQKRVQRRTPGFTADHQDHAAQMPRHGPR
jgi:hypothetical protein